MSEDTSKDRTNVARLTAIVLGLPWVEILAEAWKYGQKLLRGMTSEGIYEVLSYEMNLQLHDANGKKATYRKRQKVRYLQNNVIAYHDQAWGDGETLLNYRCSPGTPVDRYRYAHKTLILISLRQIRNRGDKDELQMEWDMRDSFTQKVEEWITSVSHRTGELQINVTFPKKRPPLKMAIIEANRQRQLPIRKDALRQLPDGQWKFSWTKKKPHLYEDYIFRWEW